jgi:hypothetical protein
MQMGSDRAGSRSPGGGLAVRLHVVDDTDAKIAANPVRVRICAARSARGSVSYP